jgi:hypothetical protein
VRVCALDRFGFLTDPGPLALKVTHNGTAGALPVSGVVLNGFPAAPAGVPLAFGAAADPRGVARLRFRDFTEENVTLSVDDGAGHTGQLVIQVHPAGAVKKFQLEIRRRGGGASVVDNPPHVRELLECAVKAVDDDGRLASGFRGKVTLKVVAGDMGRDGPPKRGVHVKVAEVDPFRADAFKHEYVAADNGEHVFPLVVYTTGSLQLKATNEDESLGGESRAVDVRGAAVHHFLVQVTTPQTVGKRFAVTVTAADHEGNRIEDFTGSVRLGVVPGQGTAGAMVGGVKSGVMINDTANPVDDTFVFGVADNGEHHFEVACYTLENVRFRATHAPAAGPVIIGDSGAVAIRGNALHHFGLAVRGAHRAGTPFELEVSARDAADRVVPSFAGAVTLNLTMGSAFVPGAGPVAARGVRIETTAGVIGNVHAFVAADNGAFTFRVTPFSAETIRLRAVSGAINSSSDAIVIEGSAIERFLIAPGPAKKGVAFPVTVNAQDANANTVHGFVGTVTLSVRKGAGAWVPAGAYGFSAADGGIHVFMVAVATDGAGHQILATDGNIETVSAAFNVAP